MDDFIFSISSWPRAIVHIDGDAFFTSCEEVINPELRGKPIITGGERGIVACANYPAKERGITRGVSLRQAKIICPNLIILPSDYKTYSLYSRRMFNIMRRFTPDVEEYSIDEAFADITGLRRVLCSSYAGIAEQMKRAIERELGLGVSVGVSLTKVLAKVGSKHQKPRGLTVIAGRSIARYLENLPVGKIWGIGPATTSYLTKMGVRTALDFARIPEGTIRELLTKPGIEIWKELRGRSVYPVISQEKSVYASISKMKTFAPPTSDRDYLFAHLLRNLESACIKARRYGLAPKKIISLLRTLRFRDVNLEATLIRPSALPLELSGLLRELFDTLHQEDELYWATGVVLLELTLDTNVQYSLFESPMKAEKIRELYEAMDTLSERYGKHALHLGASHPWNNWARGSAAPLPCGKRLVYTARPDVVISACLFFMSSSIV